jgi:hypothetical protein
MLQELPNYALQRTSGVTGQRRFDASRKNKEPLFGGIPPGYR